MPRDIDALSTACDRLPRLCLQVQPGGSRRMLCRLLHRPAGGTSSSRSSRHCSSRASRHSGGSSCRVRRSGGGGG